MERARGACRPRVVIVTCIGFVSCKPIHVTITTRGGRRARFTVQRIRVPPCNPTHATTIRGLENAVWAGNIRFSHLFSSSLFSFLLSKTSRFSFCPPSFYLPHSLGHRHFICVSMRRKRSLRAGPGTFSVTGGARGQHPPLSDGTKGRTPTSLYALGSSCRCIAYEECAEYHEPMCDDCLWGDSNLEALRGTPRPAMNAVHSSASIAAPSHCPATWGNALR